MSVAMKVNNLVKAKEPGDRWACYQAPEEFRMWNLKNGWKSMSQYDVAPIFIKVKGVKIVESNSFQATQKAPKILNCGIPVTGASTISSERRCHWTVRVDSVREINSALTELAKEYRFEQFEVRELEVNHKNGAIIFSEIYNPDGNGTALYSLMIELNGKKRYAPNMDQKFQEHHLDKFIGVQKANCGIVEQTTIANVCAIENRIPMKAVMRIPGKKKKK